jgi:hypothetical protein
MLPRQRVFAALEFRPPDAVPLEYHSSPAGFYAHGERLRELWTRFPDDFGPADRFRICAPGADCVDREGRYCEVRRDDWGVVRRSLTFGTPGLPIERPLDDWRAVAAFRPPAVPALARGRERASAHQRRFFLKSGWISLFELMHALRRFEDVLVDIASDRPEIHRLADELTEYHLKYIHGLLDRGADAIQFGDDFGTQSGLILSPKMWRAFFKPRYRRLMRVVRDAGKKVFFHSCGRVSDLFEELVDLGVDAIWPQLNAYDERRLADFCRQAKVAIALQPDRGHLMIESTPEAVRRYVWRLAEVFAVDRGGAWFYVEIDQGFPWENIAALTETVACMRGLGGELLASQIGLDNGTDRA